MDSAATRSHIGRQKRSIASCTSHILNHCGQNTQHAHALVQQSNVVHAQPAKVGMAGGLRSADAHGRLVVQQVRNNVRISEVSASPPCTRCVAAVFCVKQIRSTIQSNLSIRTFIYKHTSFISTMIGGNGRGHQAHFNVFIISSIVYKRCFLREQKACLHGDASVF